jgi:hypothetical protein
MGLYSRHRCNLATERPRPHSGAKLNSDVDCYDYISIAKGRLASIAASGKEGQGEARLDAAKLERLWAGWCGPLWQSELARTMGVSRQTILRWVAGEFDPPPQHTAKAKALARARIGELQRLLKVL